MKHGLNLAFDPWIPCIRSNGSSCLASLCQCCTDPKITDIAVRPHERVSLMRFFLCIAYAALDIPEDYTECRDCFKNISSKIKIYLESQKDSFELFHETKPFLQIAELKLTSSPKQKSKKNDDSESNINTSVAKLDFSLASGNSSILYDHDALNTNRKIPIEKIALDLLTYQMFSPGGLIGQVTWKNILTSKTSCDAPCISSSMVHTFIRGNNISETIVLNMLSVDELHSYTQLNTNWKGVPIWDKFPTSFNDKDAIYNATYTFIGRLVPLTRSILLKSDCTSMLLGDGLSYPSYTNKSMPFPPEPSATLILSRKNKEEERILLNFQPGKALWRQLHALTVLREGDGLGGCLALTHAYDYEDNGVDIVVSGLARNKASILDSVESVFHITRIMQQEDGQEIYREEVQLAEKMERDLRHAMELWRVLIDGGWNIRLQLAGGKQSDVCMKLREQASRDYWTMVEKQGLSLLKEAINALNTDQYIPNLKKWRQILRNSSLIAYSSACNKEGERQLRAFVIGKRKLLSYAKKNLDMTN